MLRDLVLVGLWVLGVAGAQAPEAPSASSTAEAKVTDSEFGRQATLRNQSYDFVTLHNDDGSRTHLLIHRQQDIVRATDLDGYVHQELFAEAWEVTGSKKTNRFRLRENASSSSIDDTLGLLIANNFGCCDVANTYAAYSLKTGKRLFFAGGGSEPHILNAVWPNQPRRRLVGVHAAGSARDNDVYPEEHRDKAHARLMITLGDEGEALDRLVVQLPGRRTSWPLRTVEWSRPPKERASKTLEVWPSEGSQPPVTPRVSITLVTGEKIELPIEDKRFDLNRAAVPKGTKIDRLAPK